MESVFDNSNPVIYQNLSQQYHIVGNWLPDDTATARGHVKPTVLPAGLPVETFTLAPGGCAAFGLGGDVVAGWFSSYNHRELTLDSSSLSDDPQLHSIIEDRTSCDGGDGSVCVWHAFGADTTLDIHPPVGCATSATTVAAVGADGKTSPVVSQASSSGLVSFMAAAVVGGAPVDHFKLQCMSVSLRAVL